MRFINIVPKFISIQKGFCYLNRRNCCTHSKKKKKQIIHKRQPKFLLQRLPSSKPSSHHNQVNKIPERNWTILSEYNNFLDLYNRTFLDNIQLRDKFSVYVSGPRRNCLCCVLATKDFKSQMPKLSMVRLCETCYSYDTCQNRCWK